MCVYAQQMAQACNTDGLYTQACICNGVKDICQLIGSTLQLMQCLQS